MMVSKSFFIRVLVSKSLCLPRHIVADQSLRSVSAKAPKSQHHASLSIFKPRHLYLSTHDHKGSLSTLHRPPPHHDSGMMPLAHQTTPQHSVSTASQPSTSVNAEPLSRSSKTSQDVPRQYQAVYDTAEWPIRSRQ